MAGLHLVTTAEQQSWPSNGPVLFLGQWCLLHEKREQWQNLDFQLVAYRWDDRELLFQEYQYLQSVTDKIMPHLASALNHFHGCSYSVRFWQILCGSWLSDFLEIVYERWQMLQQAFQDYHISQTTVLTGNDDDMVPMDMEIFPVLFVDDRWNHWLYSRIIRYCFTDVDILEKQGGWAQTIHRPKQTQPNKKDKIKDVINFFSGLLGRSNNVFFHTSRLKPKDQALLDLRLGQMPVQWFSGDRDFCEVDWQARRQLKLDFKADNEFEHLLKQLICEQIPRFYMEGFSLHQQLLRDYPWPKAPKVIFSSNSYSHDDMFKLYAAQQTEQGSKLLIGQHGGNYGVGRWNSSEQHNLKVADFFVNWGWSDDNEKRCKALPAAGLAHVEGLKPLPHGNLLLATMAVPRYSYWLYSMPSGPQMLSYIDGVIDFFKGLDNRVFEQSLMRPYPWDLGWSCDERYLERLPNLQFDDRKKVMLDKLADCRLFIGSYDATTQLETLASNYPSVLFWDPCLFEIRPEAEEYYELLRDAKILHDTPQSAASHVNEIWDDVSGWWDSEQVQQARIAFCRKYAWQSSNWLGAWATFFKQLMK